MRRAILLISLLTTAVGAPAIAQDDARYAIEKSENGYVRMDSQTGEMSICEERSGQLVCKLAADERSAFESEIDRLQQSLDELSKRVGALESAPKSILPTEDEFSQTMTYMQRFFRGFMDIVKEFDRDLRGDPQDPTPQRT